MRPHHLHPARARRAGRRLTAALLMATLVGPALAAPAMADRAPGLAASSVISAATDDPAGPEGESPDEPRQPEDERPDAGDGPQTVVWFLAAGAVLAMALGFFVLVRGQRTRNGRPRE